MPKTKISEYSATANSNTDVGGINVDEGCAPSGINDAIRTMMAQLKNFQTGTGGDSFNGPVNGTVGATTPATAAVTTLTTSSTVTHNGGTANGVGYLNGSKVLTTGSALVFDGTNLGVGVTPTSRVDILQATNDTTNGLNLRGYTTGTDGGRTFNINTISSDAGNWANLNFKAHQFLFSIQGTEKMRLNSSGNLGIGTTSPVGRLDVVGDYARFFENASGAEVYVRGYYGGASVAAIQVVSNSPLAFLTSNQERARIDSSGNLLVGITSSSDGSVFKTASGFTALSAYRASSTAASGAFAVYSDVGGTQTVRAYVRNDGGLANYSANDLNLSDERLKKDIAPAGAYLAKICAIPVKTFRYNDQAETEDLTLGVIAQEVQQIAPELVSSAGFGTNEENQQDYLSIYQTDLQYALMKAIQEQQALITSLTTRITALEGN